MLKAPAPAKINLALHVTSQRDDGYHLLDTLVTFADVGDFLKFEPDEKLSLSITGPEADNLAVDNNLVLRAARALVDHAGRILTVAITLEKNLPVASGIGGGSADAAATLRGLINYWRLDIDKDALRDIALSLGADVPMCLAGQSARVTGIGEHIEAVSLPPFAIVLVNPRVVVSTPDVFARLNNRDNALLDPLPKEGSWMSWLTRQRNDLQHPALSIAPVIQECLTTLETQSGCQLVRMSGSGATCFGIFDDHERAKNASQKIAAVHPDWWVVATRTIG